MEILEMCQNYRKSILLRSLAPDLAAPAKGTYKKEGNEYNTHQMSDDPNDRNNNSNGTMNTGALILSGYNNNNNTKSSVTAPASVSSGSALVVAAGPAACRKRLRDNASIGVTNTAVAIQTSVDVTSNAIIDIDPDILKRKSQAASGGGEFADQDVVRQAVSRHNPWIPFKILKGHQGAVQCVAVDPDNNWFATGGVDTLVKVWGLSKGELMQDLTGHKETVRGIALSTLSPYMFTCSEDHSTKCWDLDTNTVIRDFHGHRGAVTSVATHPMQQIIVTGSRDKQVKVWDIRSKRCVHHMVSHTDTVLGVACQASDPQIVSHGADKFVYLWDLGSGKPITRITSHKKSVTSVVLHPVEESMVTVGADNIRKWKLPLGEKLADMMHETIPLPPLALTANDYGEGTWSCAALSSRNQLFVGATDSTMRFYDYGHNCLVQQRKSNGGIQCGTFDVSGTRLITGEDNNTIVLWKQRLPNTKV
eukprot:Tbor_TRINITY_DN3793_c0_g1::TRINITY_DN3793_c0_g1_i1::g.2485::m.2485/K12862/PLRG1, PRL1, PRP46; pleiotropic regulator 1